MLFQLTVMAEPRRLFRLKDSIPIVTVKRMNICHLKHSSNYTVVSCRYSPSLLHRENDLYEEYNLKYNSVTMTVEDADLFSSLGFTCNKSIKSGKSFNVQYFFSVLLNVGRLVVIRQIFHTLLSMPTLLVPQ